VKTKFVLLLSTLAAAALLLIAAFAILSTIVEFTNPPAAVGACEDAYEPDNAYTEAMTVTVPSFTFHSFHDDGDVDWAKFWGTAGITYTIETLNLAAGVDTKLYLYNGIGITLTVNDDRIPGSDLSSLITWAVTNTGWYYVQVGRFSGGYTGCNAIYDLSIIFTGVPCTTTLAIEPDTLPVGNTATMTATVVDCSTSPLAGKVITFSTTSGLGSGTISPVTATTDANGQAVSYISSTLAGIKLATATAPNLIAGTDTVTFTAGPPFTITLTAIPDTLPVNNTAVLSATVVDRYANPVPGQVITFSTSSGLGTGSISPPTGTTDSNGHVTSNISSTISGTKLVVATAPNLVTGTTTVTFTVIPSGCEDIYEPDDSRAEATTVIPPSITHHNFHDAPDVDWVGFQGTAGITYTIETLNLTTGVDTKLNFYSWDGVTLTLLASNDDRSPGDRSSLITWVMTTDGWYYVEAGRFTGSYYGCDAYYDLRISGPPAHVYLPIILKNHPPPEPIPPTPPPGPCYPLVETSVTVGNDPRGVAYNDDDDLIYVANYVDGTVSVINGATYSVTATINGVTGANGVAYDSDHGLVYVTNQSIDTLTVISATTNTIVRTIPVGDQPHGVAYNPTSHKVYVANYGGNSVTIIDANTMTTAKTISGLSKPAHVAANPTSNKVYVSNHGNGTVTVIRGTDDTVLANVSLGSSGPYGIAADTWRNLIYVVSIEVADLNAPNLVTIDGATDQVKSNQWGRVNIHKSDDSLVPLRVIAVHPHLGPSPGGGHLYITSSSGDVAGDGSRGTDQLLMSRKGWPEGFNKPNPLDVGSRPEEGIAVDLANHRVFVTARDVNRLTVIQDTDDHSQLCVETFALDGYVIEPVP